MLHCNIPCYPAPLKKDIVVFLNKRVKESEGNKKYHKLITSLSRTS